MAINFPSNPASQVPANTFSPTSTPEATTNGVTYTWDGVKWVTAVGSTAAYVRKSGDSMTGDLSVPSLNSGQLAGFRNILINGAVTINQRNVTYGNASVGDYWADRWKKTSGGMTQIVEDGNYKPSTTYILSRTGISLGTGISPASGDWDITTTFGDVIPSTATEIQLEEGTTVTPFELRPISVELALCQRYYEAVDLGIGLPMSRISVGTDLKIAGSSEFKVTKRAVPAMSYPNPGLQGHHNLAPFLQGDVESFYVDYANGTSGYRVDGGRIINTIYADAEL